MKRFKTITDRFTEEYGNCNVAKFSSEVHTSREKAHNRYTEDKLDFNKKRLLLEDQVLNNQIKVAKKIMKEDKNLLAKLIDKKTLDPRVSKKGKLKVCSKALHPEFCYPLIEVAELSVEKGYEPFNWLKPDNKVTALYLIEATQRHLDKLKLGIDINTEEFKLDGTQCKNQPQHASQVAYNMLMLCLQQKKGVLIDDRLFTDGELKDFKNEAR